MELSRLAGVSSRTLRHYDDIGLVAPAYVGANGYRYYRRPELLRLQEVLVLRALGLGLAAIGRVVSGAEGRADALREHRAALLRERARLTRLADAVGRTITELEGGEPMSATDLFDGFDNRGYEDEVVERWGRPAYDEGTAVWQRLGPEGRRRHHAEHAAIAAGFAAAARRGAAPADDDVQELVRRHHAWVGTFWTPDRQAYAGLGQMYVDDPRFARTYDEHQPGAAVLVRDAIAVYAARELA